MTYFYSHLVRIEPVLIKLDRLQLSDEQKVHLGEILDSTIYNTVLDLIFSNIGDKDKEAFMQMIGEEKEKELLLEFLNARIDNVEKQIYDTIDQLIQEFNGDIDSLNKNYD